jgi:predicted nucleic acid-binding protein
LGAREVAGAVVDSGPLIHLSEAGCLGLLPVFAPTYAPGEVWSEVAGQGYVPERDLLDSGLAREPHPADIGSFLASENLGHLDRGEQECLCLCRRLGISVLLTDDLAARDAAKALSITPVGSLGVIVRAYHVGRISMVEGEALLRRLQEATSLFVTPTIVDLAIEQLRLWK